MQNSIISEGNTTNEAIENGLKKLGVTKKDVEIKVLEEEKKSFFDILAPRIVKVELTLKGNKPENRKEIIIDKKTKAFYRYNTSNAKTKDGKKDGAILYNEYHAYENDKQIKVFQSGLGKVKHARIFIITTDG